MLSVERIKIHIKMHKKNILYKKVRDLRVRFLYCCTKKAVGRRGGMLSVAGQNNISPRYVIQGIGMINGYVV